MVLNPTWNQFSVAPVGNIIVVGHRRALQGGLTRESAMNLIAWLVIATEATPEELEAEMARAHAPSPEKGRLAPASSAANVAAARAQGKNAAAIAEVLARVPKPSGVTVTNTARAPFVANAPTTVVKPDRISVPVTAGQFIPGGTASQFMGDIDEEEAEALRDAEVLQEVLDDDAAEAAPDEEGDMVLGDAHARTHEASHSAARKAERLAAMGATKPVDPDGLAKVWNGKREASGEKR